MATSPKTPTPDTGVHPDMGEAMPEDTAADAATDVTTADTASGGEQEKDWQAEADKWKALARKHEGTAKANADAAAQLEQLRQSQMSEQDKAVQAARAEARAEALAAGNSRLVAAEARALAAAAKFRDPADASRYLDLSTVNVDDDGTVDTKALTSQLDDLAKTKPYLIDDNGKAPPPHGFGGGPRQPASTQDPAQQFADLLRGQLAQ